MSVGHVAIPLVVGITGHRDLRPEDVPALACRLREIFLELECSYPHTPIVLLSPLAEGADRLGARIALETGCRLIALPPMTVAEYKNDFGSDASCREFDELLAKTESWFELPVVEGGVPEAIRSPGDARNRQYQQVGEYVARHSHILIALWDGRPSDKRGGTAQ